MVGPHRTVLGRDGGSLQEGQEITLDAFARDVGPGADFAARGDLVDLVQENDPVVFDIVDRIADDRFVVEKLVGFLGDQEIV